MKKIIILIVLVLFAVSLNAQKSKTYKTEKVWRVNFLNPAIELEIPTGEKSTFSTSLGIGYDGGYPDLTYGGSGFIYIISPFMDLQYKNFYNFKKRIEKGKIIDNNSGNFISARLMIKGYSITENVTRTSNFDFAIGPTWGIQRKYGQFHLLFDMGPLYYFDTKGNGNIWPLMLQLNLGFDLKKRNKHTNKSN